MKNIKLIHKVFIAMVVVFLIPTISITMQSLHCSTEAVYELQKDALYSQAVRVNQEINSWVEERVNDLKLWQEHRKLLTYLAPEHQNHSHWKQDSSYEALLLFDEDGNVVQKFGQGHDKFSSLDVSVRERLKKTKFSVLGNVHNHNDNHYSIHLGVATETQKGKYNYSLVVLNITQAFRTIFSVQSKNYPYNISILTDAKTDVLGRLSGFDVEDMGQLFSNNNSIKNIKLKHQNERIALSQKTLIDPWIVLISADKEKTFSWIQILKERIGLTALLSVVIVLLLGALLSWGISRPFQAIIEYSRSITKGSSIRIPKKEKDKEALVVIRAIDDMLDTIRQKNVEIQNKTTLATVGELTSSVVHEFRNPLSSVKMNLQAVKSFLKDESPYSELTEIAFEQTLKLEKMLSELLTYGKPVVLEKESVKINDLITQWQMQSESYVQNGNLEIQFSNNLSIESLVIDQQKMTSVVMNLIENACNAMAFSGRVDIDFVPNDEASSTQIVIKDTGPGIPDNLLGELFLPFVTSRDDGTGLGLAIVMKFVKLHGGDIEVVNQKESGALFQITLPNEMDKASV